MNETPGMSFFISTVIILALLVLLAIGGFASLRSEDGRLLLLLSEMNSVDECRSRNAMQIKNFNS